MVLPAVTSSTAIPYVILGNKNGMRFAVDNVEKQRKVNVLTKP